MSSDSLNYELERSDAILNSKVQLKGYMRDRHQAPKHEHSLRFTPAQDPANLTKSSYSIRMNDVTDFASHWESRIIPNLAARLPTLLPGPLSADVHVYPDNERILIITSSTLASASAQRTIIGMAKDPLPLHLRSITVEFCQGAIELCAGYFGTGPEDRDKSCPPRRAHYMACPGPGASIGQPEDLDSASLGGFVSLGGRKAATTTRHQHDKSLGSSARPICVQHPSHLDHMLYQEPFSERKSPRAIGHVSHASEAGSFRPSLVFAGTSQQAALTFVEMDWAVIDVQGPGHNTIPTPSIAQTGKGHVVTDFAEVWGSTEVYGIGRTSGYSLGYTSDVPGLQYLNNRYHREWTVRQHASPSSAADFGTGNNLETGRLHAEDQKQSAKEWITGGIGVPGDSGAWLMTRDDNRVIGHVWARKTSYGPINDHRLTYFTPFVDLKADIEEKSQVILSLPATLPQESAAYTEPLSPDAPHMLFKNDSNGSWSTESSSALEAQRLQSRRLIEEIGPEAWMKPTTVEDPRRRASMRQFAQKDRLGQIMNAADNLSAQPHQGLASYSESSGVPSWAAGSSTIGDSNDIYWEPRTSGSPDVVIPVSDDGNFLQEHMANQLRRAKATPTVHELRLVTAMMAFSQTACVA